MHVFYLWLLIATSVYAKVVVHDDKLPNVHTNLIEESKDTEKDSGFKCIDQDKCLTKIPTNIEDNSNVNDNSINKEDPEKDLDLPIGNKSENINTDSVKDDNINTDSVKDDNINTDSVKDDNINTVSVKDDNINTDSDEDDHYMIKIIKLGERKTAHEDNGSPVFISSYIEMNLLEEARIASKVDADLFFGIESYTGFITVNKTYNSNIFFWYFPIKDKPVHENPWLIWLQGGPGASSMTGLFDELGPFSVTKDGVLQKNPFTWAKNHSLLFIDNPVGTGFSFTEDLLGYARDMETYSKHLYSTVEQFLQVFPELRTAPLYVSGESYGGKYVPCLAMELHKHKTSSALDINLQGVIVGNGYIEPSMIANIPKIFYNFGILQKEQLELLKPLHDAVLKDIAANRSVEAKNNWTSLIVVLLVMSHQKQAYNFLKDELPLGNYVKFLIRPDVRRAIHVGDRTFSFINLTCNSLLASDFLTSTQALYEELLENYRILLYCGHLDQMLPCVSAAESHNKWSWTTAENFNNAARHPYIVGGKVAGYHKSGGGFTEVVIRGAGHMVPVDQPEAIQTLVSSWTHNRPLSKDYFLNTLVASLVRKINIIYL